MPENHPAVQAAKKRGLKVEPGADDGDGRVVIKDKDWLAVGGDMAGGYAEMRGGLLEAARIELKKMSAEQKSKMKADVEALLRQLEEGTREALKQ